MIELTRSDDAVFVSWLQVRLGELGIRSVILDAHTNSIYGGALPAVWCRVMVDENDLDRGRNVLAEADAVARNV
jgi:hypothetical protein